jgi:hypothetical protein
MDYLTYDITLPNSIKHLLDKRCLLLFSISTFKSTLFWNILCFLFNFQNSLTWYLYSSLLFKSIYRSASPYVTNFQFLSEVSFQREKNVTCAVSKGGITLKVTRSDKDRWKRQNWKYHFLIFGSGMRLEVLKRIWFAIEH